MIVELCNNEAFKKVRRIVGPDSFEHSDFTAKPRLSGLVKIDAMTKAMIVMHYNAAGKIYRVLSCRPLDQSADRIEGVGIRVKEIVLI